jgi:hypothetical protein
VLLTLVALAYAAEPHVFNMDDGPYGAHEFVGAVDGLPVQSRVELRRLGIPAYVLESRLIAGDTPSSVLVLRATDGAVRWQRVPHKPDGPLGPVALVPRSPAMAWSGGRHVAIKPARQESGVLYLGPLGGFRFFYHSW